MDEQFMCYFRTGSGNSAKFARFYDMGFRYYYGNMVGSKFCSYVGGLPSHAMGSGHSLALPLLFTCHTEIRPISLDTFVLFYIRSLFHGRFTPRTACSRRFDYEAPLVATNENMATGSEPAAKKEWM